MVFAALAISLLISGTVLFGWAFGTSGMDKMSWGFMHPMTATCLAALSIALVIYQPAGWRRLLRQVGFFLAAVTGLVAFSQLLPLLVTNAGRVEHLPFASAMAAQASDSHKGMAPNAAAGILILSIAIMLARLPIRHTSEATAHRLAMISQGLGTFAGLIGLVAVIGYVLDSMALASLLNYPPMAISTSIALVCLSLALLGVSPRHGLMRYIVHAGPGGEMARLLMPVAVAVPLGLGWLRVAGVRAGLWDAEFGISVSVVLNVVMLMALTLFAARKLYQADIKAREVERELVYRATHDSLTNLVTRAVFREHLQRRMKQAGKRSSPCYAVFYLDLDGFKQVNDFLGHDAGDRLLTQIAATLSNCTRAHDTLARFGGDEFVILFDEMPSAETAVALAERILEAMPRRFGEGENAVPVGISIGIAIGGRSYLTPDDILRDADMALYRAKTRGKGRYEMAMLPEAVA